MNMPAQLLIILPQYFIHRIKPVIIQECFGGSQKTPVRILPEYGDQIRVQEILPQKSIRKSTGTVSAMPSFSDGGNRLIHVADHDQIYILFHQQQRIGFPGITAMADAGTQELSGKRTPPTLK